jgi:hypothetical protein
MVILMLLLVLQHSNSSGNIILAATQELFSLDVLGEDSVTVLASWLAVQRVLINYLSKEIRFL